MADAAARADSTAAAVVRAGAASHRAALAVKAAVAAALAWFMVQPLGGVADQYPYYAPLGAVVSVSPTVARSLRATGSTLLAIALGAGLALAVMELPTPGVVAVAIVVAVGTWVGAWKAVRSVATWVPLSAVFVLILGQADPTQYVAAYLGLTTMGAVLGIAVNAAFPALPLIATQATLDSLRDGLSRVPEELAEALTTRPELTADEGSDRRQSIDAQISDMHRMVSETHQAQQANWRARRWRDQARDQYHEARALEQLSYLVEEITELVANGGEATHDDVAFASHLRPPAAEALRATATVVAATDGRRTDREAWAAARHENHELAASIRRARDGTERELFVAGSLVTAIRRALNAVAPPEPGHEQAIRHR